MHATALVVDPDGTATLTTIDGLRGMQKTVGGSIEAMPLSLDTGVSAYGHDEAKVVGAERNVTAHRLLIALGWQPYPGDYPSGTIAFFGVVNTHSEDGWVETDVPQHLLDLASRLSVKVVDNRQSPHTA